jgi:hypothetical protein
MSKVTSLKKPSFEAARAFAEGTSTTSKKRSAEKTETKSGQIPDGDVRLTANIRQDLHLKLKIRAAERRTTVGELIEEWIESLLR